MLMDIFSCKYLTVLTVSSVSLITFNIATWSGIHCKTDILSLHTLTVNSHILWAYEINLLIASSFTLKEWNHNLTWIGRRYWFKVLFDPKFKCHLDSVKEKREKNNLLAKLSLHKKMTFDRLAVSARHVSHCDQLSGTEKLKRKLL